MSLNDLTYLVGIFMIVYGLYKTEKEKAVAARLEREERLREVVYPPWIHE